MYGSSMVSSIMALTISPSLFRIAMMASRRVHLA